jgi:hypothetical protein
MSKHSIEFFALPDEQMSWLREFVDLDRMWCLQRSAPGPALRHIDSRAQFSEFDFSDAHQHSFSLILGNRELSEHPILEPTAAGIDDIDFIRSQAVLLSPAILSGSVILLEGYMAIMKPGDYANSAVDPGPVQAWFKRVVVSFRELQAPGAVIQQRTSLGTTKNWRSIVVTRGAVKWRTEGRQLKQFAKGPVEFDVAENK